MYIMENRTECERGQGVSVSRRNRMSIVSEKNSDSKPMTKGMTKDAYLTFLNSTSDTSVSGRSKL